MHLLYVSPEMNLGCMKNILIYVLVLALSTQIQIIVEYRFYHLCINKNLMLNIIKYISDRAPARCTMGVEYQMYEKYAHLCAIFLVSPVKIKIIVDERLWFF